MKQTRTEALRAVERYYDTGKPCKYGHLAKRYTRSGACTQCLYLRTRDEMRLFSSRLKEKDLLAPPKVAP